MPDMWTRVAGLKGQIVKTVEGAPFTVEAITATTVRVRIGKRGNRAYLSRTAIESALRLKTPHTQLSPSEVRGAGISERTPAYIAGIINAIS